MKKKNSLNPELKNQTFHIETNQNQLHTQQTKPNFHDRISILNSTPQFSKNQKWIFFSQKPNCTQNNTTILLSASPKFNKNYAELRIDPHHEPMMRSHQKNRNSKPLTCNKTFYTNIPEQHSTAKATIRGTKLRSSNWISEESHFPTEEQRCKLLVRKTKPRWKLSEKCKI